MSEDKMRGISRRSFLKTTAAAAGLTVVPVGGMNVLSALAEETNESLALEAEKVVPGRCYYGGCFSCDYNVTVREGHAVKVSPTADALFGRRPCLKAMTLIQRINSKERIKYPMKRVGERGSGEWERISWEEAIKTVTDNWKENIEKYGSKSILINTGSSGAKYSLVISNCLSNILQFSSAEMCADWAVYHGLHRVYGNPYTGIMTSPGNEPFEEDIYNAKTIFMWGDNITESYMQRWRYLIDAQKKGARIVSIDPNETTTVSHSDEWFAPRPGSDPALMLAMVQSIIERDLHDKDYLLKDTVGPFLVRDDTKEFLRMSNLGIAAQEGPINPMTGKPTIIDPPAVWDSATQTAMSSNESINPELEGTWEISGYKVSTAFSVLKEHLQDYTPEKVEEIVELSAEDIRRLALFATQGPVSHMFGLGAQAYDNGLQIGTGLGLLLAVTGMVGKPGAGVQATAYGSVMNALPLFPTGTFATSIPVLKIPEVIATQKYQNNDYPPIKSLFIRGGALVGGRGDKNKIISEVINKIDFIVTADIAFNDQTKYADIVLPAAHFFEQEDIYASSLSYHLQYGPKIVEPAFEAKSDLEMTKLFADSMGIGQYVPNNTEDALNTLLDVPALKEAGITLEALRKNKNMRFKKEAVAYENGVYSTSTGKVEFYCEKPLPRFELGEPLDVAPERLPRFYPPREAWPDTELMKEYPLILMSERSRSRFHYSGFDGAWLNEINPEPTIRMNIDDANARGISEGDYVEVYNNRGHGVVKASLCAGRRPGVLTYPKGMVGSQYLQGDLAELPPMYIEPFAVNISFFDTCVEVRKWEGGAQK